MSIYKTISSEIETYITGTVQVSDGRTFSQYELVKRIDLFANKYYPTGNKDSQGNYKGWYDIQDSRINAEVKNIDFDSKDITAYSDKKNDELLILITNIFLHKWLRDNGKSEEINNDLEQGSGWGNVVWKKVGSNYETMDLRNFYVINQTAQTLEETPVIERHMMTQKMLREKKGVWNSEVIDEVIENSANKTFKREEQGTPESKSMPYYEIYERNGEISLEELKEARKEPVTDGDKDKYVMAKIVLAGLHDKNNEQILFAKEISKMPYKEYHRGSYKNRWFREGLYELLFDNQIRANEIGNQLARGLEWASKILFGTPDLVVVQNMLTDLVSGDIIRGDVKQIEVRMQGFDQLIAEWNRNLQHSNEIANSFEVVTGESLPAGTPFRLGALINQNANKLFDRIREKFAIPYRNLFNDWVVPGVLRDLKMAEIIQLSSDSEYFARLAKLEVEMWYNRNLVSLPPHSSEIGAALKDQKFSEIMSKETIFKEIFREMWDDFKPRVEVIIHGESVGLDKKQASLATFIGLEIDPVRRTALVEMAMKNDGIDTSGLPKSPPQALQTPTQATEKKPPSSLALAEASA